MSLNDPKPPADDRPVINVLFVDDDPNLLSGLRRMLHAMRKEWDMRFMNSGAEALESLRAQPADVVVSDMRMPGMDGATLLGHVRSEFPDTVRIILSGHTEFASAIRSVAVAHQFLSKPCDPQVLKTAVQRSCELQRRLSSPELRRLVGSIDALSSPSNIISALNHCLASNEPSIDEVADIVSRDVAMTAKLLQLANSAFFGLARRVTEVEQAIAYLGLSTVRDLATAAEAFRAFAPSDPQFSEFVTELEEHSTHVARLASELMTDSVSSREAYSAGLLHDIGQLVLATCVPEQFQKVREARVSGFEKQLELEQSEIGANHADIGAYLLTLWGLPYTTVEAVARHHDAIDVPDRTMSPVHAVYIAEAFARDPSTLDQTYLDELGVKLPTVGA